MARVARRHDPPRSGGRADFGGELIAAAAVLFEEPGMGGIHGEIAELIRIRLQIGELLEWGLGIDVAGDLSLIQGASFAVRSICPSLYLRCPSSPVSGKAISGVPSRRPTDMNSS